MEGKVARSVAILNKLKQTFPQTVMIQIYYALVHPLALYDIIRGGYVFYIDQKLKPLQDQR